MIDAVLSYHLNPLTCGVAKFGVALAAKLGVAHDSIWSGNYRRPLLSLKMGEIRPQTVLLPRKPYEVFLHDCPVLDVEWQCVLGAERIYAGQPAIAQHIAIHRPDTVSAFCPSTINGDPTRGAYRVLVFGMSHKLLLPHFEALKVRLDHEHPDYTVELSTAVHEGSPWDEALTQSTDAMRAIFGAKLRVLGFLGDDALAKELQDVDAVAMFYQPALRANNTTYWAAVDAGKTIYTNRDEQSPKDTDPPASWDRLVELLRA